MTLVAFKPPDTKDYSLLYLGVLETPKSIAVGVSGGPKDIINYNQRLYMVYLEVIETPKTVVVM